MPHAKLAMVLPLPSNSMDLNEKPDHVSVFLQSKKSKDQTRNSGITLRLTYVTLDACILPFIITDV